MRLKADGEPRADGEGSHWFCGCVPACQECHCHDCLIEQRDESRAVARRLLSTEWDHERAEIQAEHPWLKETPGSEAPPGQ